MAAITDEYMQQMLGASRAFTIVLLKDGPRVNDPDIRSTIWEHGRRNFQLRAEGVMPLVGPILDDGPFRGMCVIDGDPARAAEVMDGDPTVVAGIFTYEVHPWRSFPGDALPT